MLKKKGTEITVLPAQSEIRKAVRIMSCPIYFHEALSLKSKEDIDNLVTEQYHPATLLIPPQ